MNAAAGAREIGDLVRFGKWCFVDLPKESPLGVQAIRFDLEIEGNRNKEILDELEIRVAKKPGPGSGAGASRPSEWMAIANPNQQRFAFRRGFLTCLPQIRHPREVIESARLRLDQCTQLVESIRCNGGSGLLDGPRRVR